MSKNIRKRLSTGTSRFSDLIPSINKGEVKIPQFQRKFVWNEGQALNLLDSISANYPIGSLLLWRTEQKLSTERNIGEFHLPETDDKSPTDYILDGQQRITVIYSCIGAKIGNGGFEAYYDLRNDEFKKITNQVKVAQFPMRLLYDTTKLLNFRQELQSEEDAEQLQEKLDGLVDAFTSYQIPVVTLKDLDIEEVCPIFERINSSGTKLSMYDLLVAATWTTDFSLDTETIKITDQLSKKDLFEVDSNAILKSMSAIQVSSVRKSSILALRSLTLAEKELMVTNTKSASELATDFLVTHFGLKNWKFLPYEALFVLLCKIYSIQTHLNADQARRAEKWFWRAAMSQRYRGGSDTFVTDDINRVVEYVLNNNGDQEQFGSFPSEKQLIETVFRINNSRSQAFILLLANNIPRNITNGIMIDTKEALSSYNKHQFHHFYPKAFLADSVEVDKINSMANIIMLAASENNKISDTDPKIYVPNCIRELDTNAEEVFRTSLLPLPSKFDYSNASYDDFLHARSIIILEKLASLCAD